jgi:hypothetical protein
MKSQPVKAAWENSRCLFVESYETANTHGLLRVLFHECVCGATNRSATFREPLVTMGVLPREALRMLRSLVPATRSATTLDTPQIRETCRLGMLPFPRKCSLHFRSAIICGATNRLVENGC